jgi:2-hydroxy-6-oxonona-2,4-dienedioate hydrolase
VQGVNESAYRAAEHRLWTSLGARPSERWLELPRHATRIRVQEVGEGAPALFIHGANTSGASWAALASRLPDIRCLILDRPGTGLSPKLPRRIDAHSLPEIADTIVADILDALELPAAHLVASSLGGYIALRAAAATPSRVNRMVQFSWPVGAPTPHVPWMLRLMAMPGVGRIAASMPASERSVRQLFRRLGQAEALADGRISAADIDAYLALLRHTDTMRNEIEPVRALVSPWHGLRRLELSDELLGRIRCPIRFIWGANDPFGDAEVARRLMPRLPTATLDLMPDAGHSPWLDDLEHCARGVESFLAARS